MKNTPERFLRKGLRTWIEVDTNRVAYNYSLFRSLITSETRLMAVVKSNAYGCGLVDFSRHLEKLGVDWFGVDSIVEAKALRSAGIRKNILVFGYTLPEYFEEAAQQKISITISSLDQLKGAVRRKQQTPLNVHLKIDTGMNRQGFGDGEKKKTLSLLRKLQKIRVEGLYSHFAAAKNPAFPQHTRKQTESFERWRKFLENAGLRPISHIAATSATILFPETFYDMVRIGIGLYGLWPSEEVKGYAEERMKLKPILSWKTVIGEIKRRKKGEGVGYDFSETLLRDSVLAVCPVGYWHGYPRTLSSIGYAWVRKKKIKVIGRISMDMLIFDVTDVRGIREGDAVELLGDHVVVDELARLSETINYEIVTRLNPLMRRIYQ